jgi:hypothetical protein
MAESTLSLDYSELRSEIGYALGYKRSFGRHGSISQSTTNVTLDSTTTPKVWPQWATTALLHYFDTSTEGWTTIKITSRTSDTVLVSSTSQTLAANTNWILTPWSDEEEADIDSVLESGLRQFYYPPLLEGEQVPWNWTFLEPEFTFSIFPDYSETTGETVSYGAYVSTTTEKYTPVTINAGSQVWYPGHAGQTFVANDTSEYEIVGYSSTTVIHVSGDASAETSSEVYSTTGGGIYRLPDGHAGFTSDLSFAESDNSWHSIKRTSISRILNMRQQNLGATTTARPLFCAEVPLRASDTRAFRTTGNAIRGQRYELHIWPEPNAVYTIHATHNELQDTTSLNDYPMGGMAHGETILASCLAEAEYRIDDQRGNSWQYFLDRLRASVHRDRVQFNPKSYGYNRDASDDRGRYSRYLQNATYEGSQYFGD